MRLAIIPRATYADMEMPAKVMDVETKKGLAHAANMSAARALVKPYSALLFHAVSVSLSWIR